MVSKKKQAEKMCDALESEEWKKPTGSFIGGFVSTILAVGIGSQVLSMVSDNLKEQGLL